MIIVCKSFEKAQIVIILIVCADYRGRKLLGISDQHTLLRVDQ